MKALTAAESELQISLSQYGRRSLTFPKSFISSGIDIHVLFDLGLIDRLHAAS